jgi:TRAP transporter TAXI family solute receptor
MTRQEIFSAARRCLPASLLDWSRIGAATLALLVGPVLDPAWAQQRGDSAVMGRMNANTITVVTGDPSLAYFTLAYDLAAVLNKGDELRILPIASQGAFQNVRDVRYLHGVDLGFAQTNILDYYRRSGEIGSVANKLVYIAKICNEEIHVIARSEITSLEQLRGRKVNFTTDDSGTRLSAHEIFERLGIPVEEVNYRQNDGLEKLKNGEIAATVLTSGKPAGVLLPIKASDGYRILPIPWNRSTLTDYLPTALTHEDYPSLIAAGETIDTLATGTVLFAYNWPKDSERYRRINKFVKAFFPKLADFRTPPRHPKWRETNPAATIPGWKRFEGAERWLASAHEHGGQARRRHALSQPERSQLFEEFLRWEHDQDQGVRRKAGSNQ